jgi:hypothetical protein
VNDHGPVKLNGQVQLGTEHGQLLGQILNPEQIQSKFANGDNPIVGLGRLAQHLSGIGLPMLSI